MHEPDNTPHANFRPVPIPPPRKGKGIPTLKTPPGGSSAAIILSDSHLGVLTHWLYDKVPQQTHPCTGDEHTCPLCQRGYARRWEAWLAGCIWPTRAYRLVQITEGCWSSTPELWSLDKRFRGKQLVFHRNPEKKNARIWLEISNGPNPKTLPPAFDLPRALCKLWSLPESVAIAWSEFLLGKPPQLPPTPPGIGEDEVPLP